MKVTEHLKQSKDTLFSYEILPPLKGASIQTIYDTLDSLVEFNPPFIDVTYHREEYIYKTKKDGLLEKQSVKKRPGTVGICAAIMNKYNKLVKATSNFTKIKWKKNLKKLTKNLMKKLN